jgi:hypothetical protein
MVLRDKDQRCRGAARAMCNRRCLSRHRMIFFRYTTEEMLYLAA